MKSCAITVLVVFVTALTGCGGGSTPTSLGVGGGPTTSGTTVVVAGGNQFDTFIHTAIGAVTPAPGSPITAVASTSSCAADPANAFVVVAYNNATIVSYRINSDGSATAVTTGFTSGLTTPMAEAGGRFVYAAETSGNLTQIGGFALGSTGSLQSLPNQLTNTPVVDLVAHPNGRILVITQNPLAVQSFSIDPVTGQLTPATLPFSGAGGSGPNSMAFVQNGAFLLTAEGVAPNFPVDVLTVDAATGTITRVGSPVNTRGALFLAAHPNGRFVYAFSQNSVTPLSLDVNGIVTVGTTTTMPTGFTPTAATVDRAGATLFVTGDNGSLLAFNLDANTGLPTAAPVSTTTLNFTPLCVFPK